MSKESDMLSVYPVEKGYEIYKSPLGLIALVHSFDLKPKGIITLYKRCTCYDFDIYKAIEDYKEKHTINRDQIKSVLEKMGFQVTRTDNSTFFKRGDFSWATNKPLEDVRLELLLIYYGDYCVRTSVGSPSNGWG
jgi:hypothetical protein